MQGNCRFVLSFSSIKMGDRLSGVTQVQLTVSDEEADETAQRVASRSPRPGQPQRCSTISIPLPSWSRKANMGGTPSQRAHVAVDRPVLVRDRHADRVHVGDLACGQVFLLYGVLQLRQRAPAGSSVFHGSRA